MNPQGSQVINLAYYQSLIDQVGRVDACSDLQILVDRVMASVQAEMNGIEDQLGPLKPIAELAALSVTDLPSVITFLEKLVVVLLTPLVKPYLEYASVLAALVAAVAELTSAVGAAASRIGAGCAITIPALIVPDVPT